MAARTAASVVPPVPVLLPSQALDAQPPSLMAWCGGAAATPSPATAAAMAATAAMIRRPAAARRRKADLGMGFSIPAAELRGGA
ncbi:hypothetical protein GCM10010170_007320 [Dactylosporangium salmoneum]|uniref:Uncharacterized protein n=1 Tax=Dactylosporangium salmoneum TaxID=53361 RepID=A0ABP5SEZ1_9ACTN